MGLNAASALARAKSSERPHAAEATGAAADGHGARDAPAQARGEAPDEVTHLDADAGRSPDTCGQKRALQVAAAGDSANAHCERPCEKKLKRDDGAAVDARAEEEPVERASNAATIIRRWPRPDEGAGAALSPLNVASAEQLRQHLRDVRREVFLRPLLALVTKLMFHKGNHGLFNVRVDPVLWNIPHYLEVVKHPMDLALVKNKCLNLEYPTADACADDVRLVFSNARLFNPPGHLVHEAAALLLKEFEADFARYKAKAEAQAKRREEHSCPFCLANVCGICNEKCINFEPPFVQCSGACRQRIKRHSVYYKTPDGHYHWCSKCYNSLPKTLALKTPPSAGNNHQAAPANAPAEYTIAKLCLLKSKFLDELTEPWVQCDRCNGWVHQICALFNARENAAEDEDVLYTCPLCRVDELTADETSKEASMSPTETSVDEFPVKMEKDKLELLESHSPALKRKAHAKEFTRALGFDTGIEEKVFDFLTPSDLEAVDASAAVGFVKSQDLRSCALSQFMQKWVERHLEELGEHEAARSIVVKVVSSIKSACHVSPVVRESFRSETQEYPQAIEFTSKAIFVFQMINGVEVCIFSMYVQEYGNDCPVAANRNRTYIAYIDSLVYMRPRHVRTGLYHQILISYLASCKAKGFHYAHIWACPSTRGGDFIYWCHPPFQKNPGKDRLLQWYLSMAKKGEETGVVFACRDLYACNFERLEANLDSHLPPYFDGDYWPSEAERLASKPPKRGKLSKEAAAGNLRGPKHRKRVVDSVKAARESLFVIALQPACSGCQQLIVNASYWRAARKDDVDAYYCAQCQATVDTGNVSPTEVTPPSFVEACRGQMDKVEAETSCPFLDHRPDMLKNCEEHHYQFDSFRRAKYSTMMLVYEIHRTQRAVQ